MNILRKLKLTASERDDVIAAWGMTNKVLAVPVIGYGLFAAWSIVVLRSSHSTTLIAIQFLTTFAWVTSMELQRRAAGKGW